MTVYWVVVRLNKSSGLYTVICTLHCTVKKEDEGRTKVDKFGKRSFINRLVL